MYKRTGCTILIFVLSTLSTLQGASTKSDFDINETEQNYRRMENPDLRNGSRNGNTNVENLKSLDDENAENNKSNGMAALSTDIHRSNGNGQVTKKQFNGNCSDNGNLDTIIVENILDGVVEGMGVRRPIAIRQFIETTAKFHENFNVHFKNEFEEIQMISKHMKVCVEEASKPDNAIKNRYKTVMAYEHSRVKLQY